MDWLKNLKISKLPSKESIQGLFKSKTTPQIHSGPVLACDFGKSKIVFLEMEKTPQGIKVSKFLKIARPGGGIEKDIETLKAGFEKGSFQTPKIRVSMKGQGVVVRFVQFPQMKLQDLKSAINFEIDQYIPFKAHEVVWDCCILDDNVPLQSGTGMNVLLVAIKREELYSLIQVFQGAGLQIELIDVDALATFNALEYIAPEESKSAAFLDIGTEISTLTIAHGGKPRFLRDISFGGMDILKRLKRKLGLNQEQAIQQIEIDKAPTPEAMTIIIEALGDLVSDIKVSFNYYLDQIPGAEPVKKLFLEGGGGYHPLVIETLQKDLAFPVTTMSILEKIDAAPDLDKELLRKNQGLLPVTFGLCVRNL